MCPGRVTSIRNAGDPQDAVVSTENGARDIAKAREWEETGQASKCRDERVGAGGGIDILWSRGSKEGSS